MIQPPVLLVIAGLPGSGKSTVAAGLAGTLRFPVFSVDPIESAILQSGFQQTFETGLAAYVVAEMLAAEQLKLGLSVIIDAVSPVREARDMWHGLSRNHQARMIVIECVPADPEVHRIRIEARVRHLPGMPEVTWEDVEYRRGEYLPWDEPRLTLDTSQPREVALGVALDYVRSFL